MTTPIGFGGAFTTLADEDVGAQPHLPEPFRQIYGGDWRPLAPADRPYTFVNFVTSRDGRISFAEPGHAGGGDVSGFCAADAWLMGLLRACADTVLVGDGTLRAEPEHIWTSEFIFPTDRAAFAGLRGRLGLSPQPLHVFLSIDGAIEAGAAVFAQPELRVLIATTAAGAAEAERRLRGCAARAKVLALGEGAVDLAALMRLLHSQYGARALLCEGGPRVYGAMLRARAVDEEFLTLSPLAIGAAPGRPRPSLIEGAAFSPGDAPRAEIISLKRVQSHLFLRSRWLYR